MLSLKGYHEQVSNPLLVDFRSSSHLVCFAESYLEKFHAKITATVW